MLSDVIDGLRSKESARLAGDRPGLVRMAARWQPAGHSPSGLPGGLGLNIGYETVDRHAEGYSGLRIALRCLDRGLTPVDLSYADLAAQTNRFAQILVALGVKPGDCVAGLMGRRAELYVAALGTLKHRSVFCPLFANFGPDPIATRLNIAQARVLVTTDRLYRRKVEGIRASLPALDYVLIVREDPDAGAVPAGTLDLVALMAAADDQYVIQPTAPDDPALLHFTSGTTGQPKGAIHVHGAIASHLSSARLALDLGPGDHFWCTADPGWVTGISYGMLAPLAMGATLILDREEFDGERWCRILQDHKVSVWYTAPTAIRMLMRVGIERVRSYDFSHLRVMASVGEPLDGAAVRWTEQAFGVPCRDTWWQTETGAIMIARRPGPLFKPGAMGRPLPGIEAVIVNRRDDGGIDLVGRANEPGELALRAGWDSMFRGYLGEPDRYRACFVDGWYLTGDIVRRDGDGDFWFVGRADDVIKSAGHLIGPSEVETALREHPAVADAAVIGLPDSLVLETVKAFVVVKPGVTADEALQRDLMAHARRHLGPCVAPREIAFRTSLPKTRSGKTLRRLLKARELGLPEGDLSAIRPDESN